MKDKVLFLFLVSYALSGCSPLKSSPNSEKHQMELTLHEVQTNLDDLRHNINCFQTELQILDGRIKSYENALASLKQQDLDKQQTKMDALNSQVQILEKKWRSLEKDQQEGEKQRKSLSLQADETLAALAQFKDRIAELEQELHVQNSRFEEVAKLKGNIESLVKEVAGNFKIYKVRAGDSLERIARAHKTSVEKIKQSNRLDEDLIVIGQELKIPVN